MADMSDMPPPAAAGPSPRTLKRVGIAAGIAAIAIAGVGIATRISATGDLKQVAAEAAVPTVAVVRPASGGAGDALVLPGNVQALNSAAIYARTNGYVRRWLADIGDHVRTGQPLAILDAPEIDQQLAQATADYQTALANQKLAATTAQRWSTMLAKDAVSRQEADEKAGDLAAKSALANAALANVRRLRALQGFTRLYAPFNGVVTSRSAQIGQLVVAGNAASQPLFTVSDASRVRVFVRVPQGASAEVHPGMTATLSHIALRRLSGESANEFYTPLEGVKLSLSEEGTLVIDAPHVSPEVLTTTDVAELKEDQQFKVVGRKDNVINSGGIKIQAEEVERLLRPYYGDTFAITSAPDPKFGQIVVLATTEAVDETVLKAYLPVYYQPKRVIWIEKLPLTETGKVERGRLREIAKERCK